MINCCINVLENKINAAPLFEHERVEIFLNIAFKREVILRELHWKSMHISVTAKPKSFGFSHTLTFPVKKKFRDNATVKALKPLGTPGKNMK